MDEREEHVAHLFTHELQFRLAGVDGSGAERGGQGEKGEDRSPSARETTHPGMHDSSVRDCPGPFAGRSLN